MITLNVNGTPRQLDVPDDMPLLWVLRDVLGMTGTKFGCGLGLCGACTVHIDGAPTRSCIMPLGAVIRKADHHHRRRWRDPRRSRGAKGMACAAKCLNAAIASRDRSCRRRRFLRGILIPADLDIDAKMFGNICRCGTYIRIREAIKRAAHAKV